MLRRGRSSACCRMLAIVGCAIAAMQSSVAQELEDSEFTVLSADINDDGYPDLLLIPKTRYAVIAWEIAITIPIKPVIPAFAILSNPDGTYYLVSEPDDTTVDDPDWEAGDYEMVFGDFSGDGEEDVFIQALTAGNASFLVSTTGTGGALVILSTYVHRTETITYSYDELGRLSDAEHPNATVSYGYDDADNRTSRQVEPEE